MSKQDEAALVAELDRLREIAAETGSWQGTSDMCCVMRALRPLLRLAEEALRQRPVVEAARAYRAVPALWANVDEIDQKMRALFAALDAAGTGGEP